MKVLIVTNLTLFETTRTDEFAIQLENQFISHGHESEVLRIPIQLCASTTPLPSQLMMIRCLELLNVDKVIALQFPSYLIRHPKKILWILDHYTASTLHQNSFTQDHLSLMKNADDEALAESQKIFTNTTSTFNYLSRDKNLCPKILMPPHDAEHWTKTIETLLE